jgi:ferredoxin
MAYKITEDCINCGACEAECKNEAISEGEETFVIDSDKCTECVGWFESPKCAEVCPVDACAPNPDRQETREQLLGKWSKLHPGETPAVT